MNASFMTLAGALLLALVYLLGGHYRLRDEKHPQRWLSIAAGASMAYVFLEVLPELGARHRSFLENAGDVMWAEHRIYAMALVGFIALYALDAMVKSSHGVRDETRFPIFWIDIGGFALYGGVIGDALVSRGQEGMLRLCLYVVAMAFHLLVVTSSLAREHGRLYHSWGRWALAASMVAGWMLAAFVPLSEVVMARLFAFVAGGVIMTSANEELPREKGGRFGWFVIGAGAYGSLLLFI